VADPTRDHAAQPAVSLLPDPDSESWQLTIGEVDVHFGAGSLARVGELAARFGQRALLVTDPGLVSAGHVAVATSALERAGLAVLVFDEVAPNPTTVHVEAGTEVARRGSIEVIIALGGGSAMDCAKGINFLATNGGRLEDYWGLGKATQPMLPSLGVPTTAGTGSEAQSYALITQPDSHRKMACGDPKARFRTVLLDPDLLASVPRRVAAAAGMDALSHALESHVTTVRSAASAQLSRRAFELLEPTVAALAAPPANAQVRAHALLGAHLAGAAIEASMLGGAHAAANPLTARHGVAHGEAVGLMLPHVLRFNAATASEHYRQLSPEGADGLARRIQAIRSELALPQQLSDVGIGARDIPAMAAAACDEWTGSFNPRPLDRTAFEELYAAAL